MQFKTFTRLFLLIGMMGWLTAPSFADEITIGSGTSTTYDAPINTYYKYSLTEMIYTAEEIENAGGGAGTISNIGFHYALSTTKDFNVVVFMKQVSRSSFSSTSDFESLTASDIVYEGTMSVSTPGWVTLELQTPFDYNGESNLLIAFDNNTGSYIGSSGSFYYTTTSERRLWKYQNDYTNPDPLTFTSYSSGGISYTLPNLQLEIATSPVSCAKPKKLAASNVGARTATLDWTKGSDDQDTWEVYLTQTATDVPTDETTATYVENVTKPFTLNGLTPDRDYYAYVRANCGGENGKSKWSAVCHFTTHPSCFTPTVLTCNQVTSNGATLSWNAGTGQDAWEVYLTTTATDVPDDESQATYPNVNSNPYTLSNLTPQTKYYAYVRANCGDVDGKSGWSNMCTFFTPQIPVVIDAEHPSYTDDFESETCNWVLVNGDRPNQWCLGEATNNGGSKAIYISNDNGASNAYTASYQSKSMVYATKAFTFDGIYTFSFDWNCKGSYSDYFRVALVPASVELTAGTAVPHYTFSTSGLPQGWIALDGGSKLNPSDNWTNHVAYEMEIEGDYMMVFAWLNTSTYGGDNPPVAIDNVSISYVTCPRPTNLTASNVEARSAILTWAENGNADNWTLQYANDATFSTNLIEINDGFVVSGNNAGYGITGLSGETTYYARVKSDCDSDWSDAINFTTLATCTKPTLSYVSNSNTAYSGSVSWTGSTADAFEIAYRPTTDFDPSDLSLEDVIRVQLGSVNEYTLQNLTPETKYYIYVQADCGELDGKSAWSNRVIFTTLATCIAPSSLTKQSTTSSSVTLSWTKGADDQDAWQFRYKKTSDSDYTYLIVENQSEPLYTIEGLEAATEYKVNVQALCGGDDYSKWSYANQTYDLTITTECADLTMPYFNDFEGLLNTSSPYSSSYPMPKCWTRSGNQTNYPYVFSATTSQPYNHGSNSSSGHCIRFYRNSSSYDAIVVLPAVDGQYQMEDLQIRFWARLENYNSGKDLVIGIMEDPSDRNTFAPVETVTINNPDNSSLQSYKEYTVSFENYQGNGRYIAIRQNTSMYAIYVDDITVEMIPSCRIPKDLEASDITDSQATMTWTAGKDETAWNLQYKKASDSDWSASIPVTGTPTYILNSLMRGTVYDVRVQANCSVEDQSDWSEAISFQTECGTWPIDDANALFEDFNGETFPPSCWDWIRVSNYYGWQHSSGQYNPLDTQGTAYSYWPTGDTYLILPQMHINGDATLSFDMVFQGSGSGETSSVVLSTNGFESIDFTTTLWTADVFPTSKTNVSLDLSAYNNQDVYIAFKYTGIGTDGRMWYIDNVHVYVGEIFTKDISAYSGDGGYYLIASPIGTVQPENVTNMLNNDYDFYYFDQAEELEWRNYEANSFSLEPGKGYLYANNQDVTLKFIGTPYNGNGVIDLTYTTGADLAGWNLIGNPFATAATIDKPYYRLNANGDALKTETENTAVAAMEGVFVQATETGQTATFAAQTRDSEHATVAHTNIVVSGNHGNALDNAIVRFDKGETLGKFQLKENSTKVYIPVNGKDYAIVNAKAQNELPINFKAAKNGTYTLSVNTENVAMNYLHLIDNMNGTDIDLLVNPSYTFEAKTTDYASRFKMMFVCEDANDDTETFAYFNGNVWSVSNMGEAILQIIDMHGRVLHSETINGNATIGTNNLNADVYVMRLINRENVKTQKIIIK